MILGRRILAMVAAAAFLGGTAAGDELDRLAEDPTWLKLGRYNSAPLSGGYTSDIITPEFFLAAGGAKDPEAELRATLAALSSPLGDDPDTHALCRFPARAIWLDERLALNLPDPAAACPSYREWTNDDGVRGASVLFISGYLSNPGSAFGHLLLRLHTDEEVALNDVLDRAINYGAAESEEDALVPYIIKGLSGQYHSRFSSLEFFHHSERFRETQLRNVWEYRLDLDREETAFLTAHIWEVMRTENKYYFLRQNCAYRIAELVELVIDRELVPDSKIWIAPIDVFHRLAEDPDGAKPALSSVKRLASRETVFREGYLTLSGDDQAEVDSAIAQPNQPLADGLTPATLDVLIDYYAFADESGVMTEDTAGARSAEAVRARLQLPAGRAAETPPPTPPHDGQRPSLFQATALYNDALGEGLELRVRPALSDFLSRAPGAVPYSELSMADLRLVLRDGRVFLRSLEAVRVTALNVATKGAPAPGGKAWRVRLGAETRDLSCDDCLTGFGEAAVGKAAEISDGIAVYGFVTGHASFGDEVEANLKIGPTAGFIFDRERFGLAAEAGYLFGIDNTGVELPYAKVETRLARGKSWDLRAGIAYKEELETGLSFGAYW